VTFSTLPVPPTLWRTSCHSLCAMQHLLKSFAWRHVKACCCKCAFGAYSSCAHPYWPHCLQHCQSREAGLQENGSESAMCQGTLRAAMYPLHGHPADSAEGLNPPLQCVTRPPAPPDARGGQTAVSGPSTTRHTQEYVYPHIYDSMHISYGIASRRKWPSGEEIVSSARGARSTSYL
jgi:hypothetical protein